MTDLSSKSDRSHGSARLLLRVHRAGSQPPEYYLADGLTIGRSAANTVDLSGDDTVERSHARIEMADGAAHLKCIGSEALIFLDNTTVRELVLSDGVKFRIGKTNFDCLPGLRQPLRDASPFDPACPHCGSREITTTGKTTINCPACNRTLLAIELGPPDHTTMILPQKLGAFSVDRFVARGGMGIVLKGHSQNKTPVAIKVPLHFKGVSKQSFERFRREIVMIHRICHPNVVRFIGCGHVGRINFLVMEWINGKSLRDYIAFFAKRKKSVLFDVALKWLEQVCKGLADIHADGIVHRDIKPSNILIRPNLVALISDLGIAKEFDASTGGLTTTGELLGSHEYMAPEQASTPDAVDQRTDLYSLGVTAYELLTGTRPVGDWSLASQINRTVPITFDAVLDRLLKPKMEDRFADIHEVLATLKHFTMSGIGPISATDSVADLMSCPGCSMQVSDQAESCPHCGAGLKVSEQNRTVTTPLSANNFQLAPTVNSPPNTAYEPQRSRSELESEIAEPTRLVEPMDRTRELKSDNQKLKNSGWGNAFVRGIILFTLVRSCNGHSINPFASTPAKNVVAPLPPSKEPVPGLRSIPATPPAATSGSNPGLRQNK